MNTSKLSKRRKIEKSFENSSVIKSRTSTTQNVIFIETIESISSVQVDVKTLTKKTKMRDSSIKSFWDKRDDRENSDEYLKNIEFIYQIDYKTQEAIKNDKIKYKDNVHRILFKQNLKRNVENWYFDLSKIVKEDWKILRTSFKNQFEMKIDVKVDKYLFLQRVTTLIQRSNEDITNYFRRAKSLTRHLFNAVETIKYNVVQNMKDKIQRKRVNFECNKNRNFSLKKIKLIIKTTYQTIVIMSSFDLEWNHSKNSFNLSKRKEKTLSTNEWNQQILSSILQRIRNIIIQNEKKEVNLNEEKKSKNSNVKIR
jgi:hypothetical protein